MADRNCTIPDCGKRHEARGFCPMHYRRFKLYGDPLATAPRKLPTSCTVDECGQPYYGGGLCEPHYARRRRHGGLHDKRAERTDPRARFLAKINPNGPTPAHRPELGPCALWTGPPNGAGYGSFSTEPGRPIGAHVAAVIFDGREVPGDMEVDHLCRTRMCVRASHLEVVTHEENIQRALAFRERPEVCLYGHDLTPDNIMASQGAHACRKCFKDSQRRYRERRRLRTA